MLTAENTALLEVGDDTVPPTCVFATQNRPAPSKASFCPDVKLASSTAAPVPAATSMHPNPPAGRPLDVPKKSRTSQTAPPPPVSSANPAVAALAVIMATLNATIAPNATVDMSPNSLRASAVFIPVASLLSCRRRITHPRETRAADAGTQCRDHLGEAVEALEPLFAPRSR